MMKQLDVPLMLRDVVMKRHNNTIGLERALELTEWIGLHSPSFCYKMDTLHACMYYRGKELRETAR